MYPSMYIKLTNSPRELIQRWGSGFWDGLSLKLATVLVLFKNFFR